MSYSEFEAFYYILQVYCNSRLAILATSLLSSNLYLIYLLF